MENTDATARLRVFALLIRYGHELFAADGLEMAAGAAVNDAHEIVPYVTSSLFETTDGEVKLLAQYGQAQINPHAAISIEQRNAIRAWLKDPTTVPEEGLTRLIRLPLPKAASESKIEFVWLVEFKEAPVAAVGEVLKLIGATAGQALAYHRLCRPRHVNIFRRVRKPVFWGCVGALLLASLFLRVPESTTAEFSVRSPEETTVYAWFDGAIADCPKKDGERVRKGDVVVRYDISQLAYRMALAKTQLAETEAELALARQNAFSQPEELGRVKQLEVHSDGLRVGVEEAQWYIDHSEVKAPADGVVALTEGDATRLENKAVRTGDELFRVLGGAGYEAEIPVNEREASVLRGGLEVTLFLHTAPERAIPAKVLEVSHYPQLTEQKTWAYRVRVALDGDSAPKDLRYGMRGIAKLRSGKVSLGYRIFKSAVLYLRGL